MSRRDVGRRDVSRRDVGRRDVSRRRIAVAFSGDRGALVADRQPEAATGAVDRWAPEREGYLGDAAEVIRRVAALDAAEHPRWVWWRAGQDARRLVQAGVSPARCWDVAEAHRLLDGGWQAEPARAWAYASGLGTDALPEPPRGDLFDFAMQSDGGDHGGEGEEGGDDPVRPDGHLVPQATTATWLRRGDRLLGWARTALTCAALQEQLLGALGPRAIGTAHSESAAALLCVELERDGLPVDRQTAEQLIAESAGPRAADEAEARAIRERRDAAVLSQLPGRDTVDLRNPLQVKEMLAAVGVVVPNTRAWVLRPYRETHPVVEALLAWRKAERIATTYGYSWLDAHVGADGRLRGSWTACDGAGGRMTAHNGLHNLPTVLRAAVEAESAHVFVRADLGQIEPRVLAAVSGDRAFAAATRADDLYAPVAAALGVERPVAKVAVLAAMYGQRRGAAGAALQDLERTYPVAMQYLDHAYAAGLGRRPIRTFGGRLIRTGAAPRPPQEAPPAAEKAADPAQAGERGAARDAARGRFVRNAVVQGAAAELFKAWAATVRATTGDLGARIVLCLHDELLVQVPEEHAREAVTRVEAALLDSARRWSGSEQVRFVADTSVIRRWSEAKE